MQSPEDNSLDGLLRRSLASDTAQGECPDAELVAAYSDHTLDPDEIARWESHFSQCSRCRELLTAMVRSGAQVELPEEVPEGATPVLATAATPATPPERAVFAKPVGDAIAAASEGAREKRPPRMLRWWWLAPVAAIALIAVVLYVRQNFMPKSASESSVQVAMSTSDETLTDANGSAKQGAPAAATIPPTSTDEESKKQGKNAPSKKSANENRPINGREFDQLELPSAPPARNDTSKAANAARDSSSAPESARKSLAQGQRFNRSGRIAAGTAGAAAGGAVSGAPAKAENPAPAATPGLQAQNQAVQVEQQAGDLDQLNQQSQQLQLQQQQQLTPQDQKAAEPRAKSALSTVTVSAEANTISTIIAIPSPDKQVIYRIVGAGFIERSTDGGATWQGQQVNPNADFTAGSAPAAKICWLVGRTGIIFRTTDGTNWKRIPPPGSLDLTAVSAKDASTATVTDVNGQKYSTENAGKIWVASR